MAITWRVDSSGADKIIADVAKRDQFVRGIAHEIQAHPILSMQQSPATGKVDPKSGHIASSPGNAPRIDTGTLVNSVTVSKVADMAYEVGTPVLHGRDTEFGIGMAPRPWLRPAFMFWQGKVEDEAQRFFDRGIIF